MVSWWATWRYFCPPTPRAPQPIRPESVRENFGFWDRRGRCSARSMSRLPGWPSPPQPEPPALPALQSFLQCAAPSPWASLAPCRRESASSTHFWQRRLGFAGSTGQSLRGLWSWHLPSCRPTCLLLPTVSFAKQPQNCRLLRIPSPASIFHFHPSLHHNDLETLKFYISTTCVLETLTRQPDMVSSPTVRLIPTSSRQRFDLEAPDHTRMPVGFTFYFVLFYFCGFVFLWFLDF